VPASTAVNMRTVVHQTSDGVVTGFPDVCNTPSVGGPIPIPYPNIALSMDTFLGSRRVTVDGNPIMLQGSCFKMSTGDEPGAMGGVMSMTVKGKAEFVQYSFDVKVEGKGVARMGDLMIQNKQATANTAPFPEIQPPMPVSLPDPDPPTDPDKDNDIVKVELISREEYEAGQ
jgi:hypothetical protein